MEALDTGSLGGKTTFTETGRVIDGNERAHFKKCETDTV